MFAEQIFETGFVHADPHPGNYAMQPDGLAVVMKADHSCMQWRGVRDLDSKMTNSIMRGSFLKDSNLRREFLSLMNDKD